MKVLRVDMSFDCKTQLVDSKERIINGRSTQPCHDERRKPRAWNDYTGLHFLNVFKSQEEELIILVAFFLLITNI